MVKPENSNKKWIMTAILIAIAFFIFASWPSLRLFFGNSDKKSDEMLDRITEMIKPAAEREYAFHAPEKSAAIRTINCKNLSLFQDTLPIANPLCLNLYKTDAAEINRKISGNTYDRVILYGEKIIWDAPVFKDYGGDFGQALIRSAKFNDQITIPAMMKLYGFSDLSFVNKLSTGKVYPFPALYFRLGNAEEIQKSCARMDSQGEQLAGCALGMWATIVPESILGENISLANQKVWRLGQEKKKDYIAYDYQWPINCYTDETLLHETAHLFMYANRIHNISDALVSPRFFNEHQADTVKILATNLVCGEGSVANFRDQNKKPISLNQFNAAYPPGKMGSAWPGEKETCQMGLLNEWNRFLAKGKFETQFSLFAAALQDWMRDGQRISDDKGMANFLIKLHSDSQSETNLKYRGCYF